MLNVVNFDHENERLLKLPMTYKRRNMTKWQCLDKMKTELCNNRNIKIGLLIGAKLSRPLEPEVVISENGSQYALTILHCCVVAQSKAMLLTKLHATVPLSMKHILQTLDNITLKSQI